MRARDAKIDDFCQTRFTFAFGKQRERVFRDRAVVLRALDRVFERAVTGEQSHRALEVSVVALAFFERAAPEIPLFLVAAAERQNDRQRDFSLAKIVADILAEPRAVAAVIERVVDKLERDAVIHAEGAARRFFRL